MFNDKNSILLSLVLLVLLLSSCNSDEDNSSNYFTGSFVYGLKVTVKGGVSSVIVTDGLIVVSKNGTYIIEILSNDFQMFTSNNVVVKKKKMIETL